MTKADKLVPGGMVLSSAGHDKGRYYIILGIREDMLLLADGTHHPAAAPKKKKMIHVRLTKGRSAAVGEKLAEGELPEDEMIVTELERMRPKLQIDDKEC